MTEAPSWAKNMTKNTMKLKELSDLFQGCQNDAVFLWPEKWFWQRQKRFLPKRLVDGPEPTDVWSRGKQDSIQDGKAEHGSATFLAEER